MRGARRYSFSRSSSLIKSHYLLLRGLMLLSPSPAHAAGVASSRV